MSSRATATFVIDRWDQQPYDEQPGASLARAQVSKTFHGELEGESRADLLLAQGQQESSRAYVGLERVNGRVHGRAGSFVLVHTAVASAAGQSLALTVVPDSATGELQGLRGQAQIAIGPDGGHSFTLDYELD